ncbi:hypothetical protein ACHAXN_002901 [Cyclotella atomus]
MNYNLRVISLIIALAGTIQYGMAAMLSTGIFTGPYHADGNLFTLEAKSNQVSIQGFDIHVDAGATTIEIYSRPGVIVTNNNDNGWLLIQTVQVDGRGKGNVTVLPDFAVPVNVPAFSKQSFYVTAADEKDVWYTIGQQLGQAYVSDDYLSILEGHALGYGFVGASGPRRWNGHVRYSFSGEAPQPTTPTANPTPKPTLSPTPKPTAYPTLLPTAKPTQQPTSSIPTTSPTTKSPTITSTTSAPTVDHGTPPPISPNDMTDEPSRSPSFSPTISLTAPQPSSPPTANPTKAATPKSTSSSSRSLYSGAVIAASIGMMWMFIG